MKYNKMVIFFKTTKFCYQKINLVSGYGVLFQQKLKCSGCKLKGPQENH